MRDAKRLESGFMLTEFNGDIHASFETNFNTVADLADEHLLSWALWEYKDFCIANHTTDYKANVT